MKLVCRIEKNRLLLQEVIFNLSRLDSTNIGEQVGVWTLGN